MKRTYLKIFSLLNVMLVPQLLASCGRFNNANNPSNVFKNKIKEINASGVSTEGECLDAYEAKLSGESEDKFPIKESGDKKLRYLFFKS